MREASAAVFLSYASQDAEAARNICDALRAAGIEVWFDQSELRGGDVWDQKIRREIHDCALFIPIISVTTASRQEGYFRLEWDLADRRSHMIARDRAFIVPVCIDDTPDSGGDVPESFARVQWSRLPAGETPPAFVARVTQLLSLQQACAPAKARASTMSPAAPRPHTPSQAAPRRMQRVRLLVAAVAVTGIGYFAVEKLILPKLPAASVQAAAPTAELALAPSAIPEKTIAVLPFLDMSEKHDQEYFSDGLSEELIDLLAQSPDLQVIARTSSFYFKGKQVTIAEIAKTLGVAHVLEGSVRKAGSKLRVTAQLIRADTGVHLWSKTYDRDAKDIFKVQDELAASVVQALQSTLSAGQVTPHGPISGDRTDNMQAYTLLLQGRYLEERGSEPELQAAIQVLKRAADLDPGYAAAWEQLAEVYIGLSNWVDANPEADMELAHNAIAKAVALNPNNAAARYQLAIVKIVFDHDANGAKAEIETAQRLDPTFPKPQELVFVTGCRAGPCYQQYIRDISRDIEHDPLNANAIQSRGFYEFLAGDLDAAEADHRHALALSPMFPNANYQLARILLARHRLVEALSAAQAETHPLARRAGLAFCYLALGKHEEADTMLKELLAKDAQDGPFEIAEVYAVRGDKGAALDWLERDFRDRRSGVLLMSTDPALRSLAHEPRYVDLLQRIGFTE